MVTSLHHHCVWCGSCSSSSYWEIAVNLLVLSSMSLFTSFISSEWWSRLVFLLLSSCVLFNLDYTSILFPWLTPDHCLELFCFLTAYDSGSPLWAIFLPYLMKLWCPEPHRFLGWVSVRAQTLIDSALMGNGTIDHRASSKPASQCATLWPLLVREG